MHEDEIVQLIPLLPKGLPIIELGGGKGGLSVILKERLQSSEYIVIEANPDLTSFPQLISYTGSSFYIDRSTNASSEKRGGSPSIVREVKLKPIKLRDIMIANSILISDIEGTEIDMILHDIKAIKQSRYFIVEFHPRITGKWQIHLAKTVLWLNNMRVIKKVDLVFLYKRKRAKSLYNKVIRFALFFALLFTIRNV